MAFCKKLINPALLVFGNLIYALGVKLFVLSADLMSCGTTGLALLANRFLGIPLTGFIFVFNVTMLVLGWWFLGKKFAVLEYEQHALTEGSHAKAISYVSVKDSNGKIFWGAGIHEDIMTSSIEALVSAINNSY